MTLDYTEVGNVQIKMIDYVKEIEENAPESVGEESPTPAVGHLSEVNNISSVLLEKVMADKIHQGVAFLCTWVRQPDMDDYNKIISGRLWSYH